MGTAGGRIVELEAEVAALRAQVQELLVQNQQLQARLAKDSHNSSKPPSSDPLGRKRPRQRRPSPLAGLGERPSVLRHLRGGEGAQDARRQHPLDTLLLVLSSASRLRARPQRS